MYVGDIMFAYILIIIILDQKCMSKKGLNSLISEHFLFNVFKTKKYFYFIGVEYLALRFLKIILHYNYGWCVLTPLMIKISFKPAAQTVKNVKLVKEFICQ